MPSAIGRNTAFHNEILAALSIEDAEAIRPHLHLVTLTSNKCFISRVDAAAREDVALS
jgi:hypothetical protein